MKKKTVIIGMMIFTIILITSSYYLMKDLLETKETYDSNIELIDDVIVKEDNQEEKIDWEKLEIINKDIIGWIKIEDTNINYPILKDNDSLYYLKHTFEKNYNRNGSIFTLDNNPFQNEETIIYGHNMRNGLMFSNLSNYMNEEFLREHPRIHIYTKNENYEATIFSVYSIGINTEENNIKPLDFTQRIEYYKKASKYFVQNINESKKIVKLYTCSYLNNRTIPTDQRYFIVANLEKID